MADQAITVSLTLTELTHIHKHVAIDALTYTTHARHLTPTETARKAWLCALSEKLADAMEEPSCNS